MQRKKNSPLKHKIVTTADEAEKQYANEQAFQLKDEGLSIINSDGLAQIKQTIIDAVHRGEETREFFSFEEYENECCETVDKTNSNMHRLTWNERSI